MTCIVGVTHKGRVYMGGDSAGVSGLDLTVRKDQKVFRNGEFAIGFTSSFRMGQILQYVFFPPEIVAGESLSAFMVSRFHPGCPRYVQTRRFHLRGIEPGTWRLPFGRCPWSPVSDRFGFPSR